MTDILWGGIAFLALLGWGIVNALTSRNHLREATALETLMKARRIIDDEVVAAVNRYRELTANKTKQEEGRAPTVLDDATEALRERLRQGLSLADSMPDDQSLPPLGPMPIEV